MLFLILLISIKITCSLSTGTSIFYKRSLESDCWSQNDIARLRARRIFEQIIPPEVVPDKINDKYIRNIIRYYRRALETVATSSDANTAISSKDLLADTIASHMRSEILPTSRFAYYAGYVSYKRVRDLHDFYNNLKIMLNTQGLGWKAPVRLPKWTNLTMEKIRIGVGKYADPCGLLITKRDSRACIHLPPPKVDDDQKPSAVALPFKTGGLVNLESSKSDNVLLKYYTTASRCILQNSPAKCRHSDFVSFNNELWHWMKRDVAPHLVDEKLYAPFGGVLRIAAAVQSYGKGLSRRNIFTYQGAGFTKWRPWKTLSETYIYVNDLPAYSYIFIVLAIAIAICLLQVFYGYIFDDYGGCHCQQRPAGSVDLQYANVDLNIPAMLPSHRSEQRESALKTKSSISSIRTQTVYDMHENKEKVMAVILSDSESSSKSSLESQVSSELENHNSVRQSCKVKRKNVSERSGSPPKIETSMSEVRLGKKPLTTVPQKSMKSTTSTATESAQTFLQEESSLCTGSSSSEQTPRSTSSKTSKTRSRMSRDLAWARRVASKHRQVRSPSGTEYKSFTTPSYKGTS